MKTFHTLIVLNLRQRILIIYLCRRSMVKAQKASLIERINRLFTSEKFRFEIHLREFQNFLLRSKVL